MFTKQLRLLSVAAALVLLAACSQPAPPEPPGPTVVDMTVSPGSGSEPALAGFYVMADLDVYFAPAAAGVIEVEEGIYLGPASPIDLTFPAGSEIPASVLSPATSFVYYPSTGEACSLAADATGVRVTEATSEVYLGFPMVVLATIDGIVMTFTSNVPIDFESPVDLAAVRFITWLYSDGAVNVETAAGGCVGGPTDPVITVDLSLQEGWNQVAWQATLNETDDIVGLSLTNADDVATVYVSYNAPPPAP